jgi:RNA polymerase sigma-70 factor (ECF subfamily)
VASQRGKTTWDRRLVPGAEPPVMTARDTFGREALAHADALYNHARRLTRNDADADELVQETYARALVGASTFAGGNLKAWLFRILRNTFIDIHHRGRRQPPLDDATSVDDASGADLPRDERELDHIRSLMAGEIDAALGTLSDEGRAIILLDVEGFTETEVAEVLGCPLGTVKSRLSRARMLLRERLKDYAPETRRRADTRRGEK